MAQIVVTCLLLFSGRVNLARKNNPEQMQAKDVKGCTEARSNPWAGPSFTGPVEGTGAYTGKVKNFGTKGYGFITMEDRELDFFLCN